MKIKFIKDYRFIGNDPDDNSDTTIKTGSVVDLENDESTQWLIDNGFAEEVKESGWWKPRFNEEYYFVSNNGSVQLDPWGNDELDEYRYSMGGCFKTKTAAERYRDYLKAVATVRQDEGVMTPEQIKKLRRNNGIAYCVAYMDKQNDEEMLCGGEMDFYTLWMPVNAILFDTEEHADASVDKHPDEWKIIANYDWSRE